MTTWTSIASATTKTFTTVNAQGNKNYDESSITYDDAASYYDNINPYLWSSVMGAPVKTWTSIATAV